MKLTECVERASRQYNFEKEVVSNFIETIKEYYGKDFNLLKEDEVKVTYDEQPRGYWAITLHVCGDEHIIFSCPVSLSLLDERQDFIADVVRSINSAIRYNEIHRLIERYE